MKKTIEPAQAFALQSLIVPTDEGIASRILFKNAGGNLTLFAFDAGQSLTEHTSPFEAFVMVLDGTVTLKIGGKDVTAAPGTFVRMPANVPHALESETRSVLLLIMLRDAEPA
jgi:quercetin dioxygenase-like cupin family protein